MLRQQAFDQFSALDDLDGPRPKGQEFIVGVDPQLVIDGVQEVLESHGILGRLGCRGVRRTVNLSASDSTAREQH